MQMIPSIEEIVAKNQPLTLEAAQKIIGKQIIAYTGDKPTTRKIFVIDKIINSYEYAATQYSSDMRYASMQAYYNANLTPESIDFQKNKYILMTGSGEMVYVALTGKWNERETPRFISDDRNHDVLYMEL